MGHLTANTSVVRKVESQMSDRSLEKVFDRLGKDSFAEIFPTNAHRITSEHSLAAEPKNSLDYEVLSGT